jgi:hypothetical protein
MYTCSDLNIVNPDLSQKLHQSYLIEERFHVDFASPQLMYKVKHGFQPFDPFLKAFKSEKTDPTIIDCTAGFGTVNFVILHHRIRLFLHPSGIK